MIEHKVFAPLILYGKKRQGFLLEEGEEGDTIFLGF